MNKIDTSTTEGKIAILTAFREGKQLQVRWRSSELKEFQWLDAPSPAWDFTHYDYRIKPLEFPKLPEGLEWHWGRFKEQFSPEDVGENYRPSVVGETLPLGSEFLYRGEDDCDEGVFRPAWSIGSKPHVDEFYRVPITTPFPEPPKPKVMVAFGKMDFSLEYLYRWKDRPEHETKVNSRNNKVIWMGGASIGIEFEVASKELEYSTDDGKTWHPCEKESES